MKSQVLYILPLFLLLSGCIPEEEWPQGLDASSDSPIATVPIERRDPTETPPTFIAKSSLQERRRVYEALHAYNGPLDIQMSVSDIKESPKVGEALPLEVTFKDMDTAGTRVQWSIEMEPKGGAELLNSSSKTPSLIPNAPGLYVLKVAVEISQDVSFLENLFIRSAFASTVDSRLMSIPVLAVKASPEVLKTAQPIKLVAQDFEEMSIYDPVLYQNQTLWPYDFVFLITSPSGKTWEHWSYTSHQYFPSTDEAGVWQIGLKIRERSTGIFHLSPETTTVQVIAYDYLNRRRYRLPGASQDFLLPPYLRGYLGCIRPTYEEDLAQAGCYQLIGDPAVQCIQQTMRELRRRVGHFNLSEQSGFDVIESGFTSGKIHIDESYVYVADKYNHRIQIFDLEEALSLSDKPIYMDDERSACFSMPKIILGKEDPIDKNKHIAGSLAGEMNLPIDVTTDKDGLVYVLDSGNHRIQLFNKNDGFSFIKSIPLNVSMQDARAIAYQNDKLFIVPYGGSGVFIVDPKSEQTVGTLDTNLSGGPFQYDWDRGNIDFDAQGRAFLLTKGKSQYGDYSANTVKVYTPKDNYQFELYKTINRESDKYGADDIRNAQDIAISTEGNVYAASQGLPIMNVEKNGLIDYFSLMINPYDTFSFNYFLFRHYGVLNSTRRYHLAHADYLVHNMRLGALALAPKDVFVYNTYFHGISIFYRDNWMDRFPEYLLNPNPAR